MTGMERFALARVGIGAALLVAPGVVLRPSMGREARGPAAKFLARGMGGRDLAMGLGLLFAVRRGAPVRGWLEAGILADSTDAVACLLALRRLPRGGGVFTVASALAAVAIGRVFVASLDSDGAPERPFGAGSQGPERPSEAGSQGPERPSGAGSRGPERPSGAGS